MDAVTVIRSALTAAKAGDDGALSRLEALCAADPTAAPAVLVAAAEIRRHRGDAAAAAALLDQAAEIAAALGAPWAAADAAFQLGRAATGEIADASLLSWAADLFDRAPPPLAAELVFAAAFARAVRAAEVSFDRAALDLAVAAFRLNPRDRGARRLATSAVCNRQSYEEGAALLPGLPAFVEDDADLAVAAACALLRAPIEDERPVTAMLRARARRAPPPRRLSPPPRDPRGRPLRVGVSQACFEFNSYYNALIPTLTALRDAGAELFAYQFGAFMGAPTAPLLPVLAAWRDLGGVDPDRAAQTIAEDQLDVLWDLEGLSPAAPLAVYRRRPAPVQATSFNTFCTVGPDCFDWVIGDAVVTPPGVEPDWDERVARMPDGYCYQVCAPREAGPPILRSDGPPTLGAVCQLWKIGDACAAAWARILRARPTARLWLRTHTLRDPAAAARIRGVFEAVDMPLDRVVFDAEPLPYDAHVQRYDQLDGLLDPFPFQGPTTIFEALWRGVPAITRQGDRWVARMGGAAVVAAGFPQWATPDVDAYVAQAVALIDGAAARRDPAARLAMRAAVAGSRLCDVAGYGRALEATLRAMTEAAWRDAGGEGA